MVDQSNVKYTKSTNGGLGGLKGSTLIVKASPHNLFDMISKSEADAGRTEYACFYVTNDDTDEKMEDCDVFMSSDNKNTSYAYAQWAIDPIGYHPLFHFTPSVYLDGTDDFIACGNHATLWSQALTKFSFSFWIFPTAGWDGNTRIVINHGAGSNHGFNCYIAPSTPGRIIFEIRNASGGILDARSDSLVLNKWNHTVCVYDKDLGSQNLKIYVDNVLGFQTANLTETINLSANLNIGESSTDFKGYVKDFRWYTNKALTVEQIDNLYDGEQDALASNPHYRQKFNEGTGTAVDEIGAKTATLTNGAEWRTSQVIPTSSTEPVGITWLGVTNGPISNTPNIGVLLQNEGTQVPVWVKRVNQPLSPDTVNDYCIFNVTGKIPEGGTTPPPSGGEGDPVPPPTSTDFVFAAVGDWGCESKTTEVVNLIKNHSPKPKVCLSLGDNAYESGAPSCWYSRVKPIDHKQGSSIHLRTIFGNHDNAESESDENEKSLKAHFGYSNTYHSFDFENVHFLGLDNTTETSFGSGSSQHNFAKADLQKAFDNPKIDWIVVYFHKPMFGGATKHSYNDGNFNQAYFPMFDKFKVDLLLSGHNHNWQQSKQVIYNSDDAEDPTIKDSSTPYTGGVGRIHCVVGTGGHDANDLYEVDSATVNEYSNHTNHGALFVTITNSGTSTTLTGRFKNDDGSTIRTFVITRTTT